MAFFGQLMSSMMSIMNIPFSIWGHTLTLWDVFGFSFVSAVVARTLWGIIDDE